jgi:hypothetical protein
LEKRAVEKAYPETTLPIGVLIQIDIDLVVRRGCAPAERISKIDPVIKRPTYVFARVLVKVVWKLTVDLTSTISSIPTEASTDTPVAMEDSSEKRN